MLIVQEALFPNRARVRVRLWHCRHDPQDAFCIGQRGAGAAERDLGSVRRDLKLAGELESVFQSMLTNAMRICEASLERFICAKLMASAR
jgi:hypothetical protein